MSTTKSRQSRHLPAFILLLLAEAPSHGGALQSALAARVPTLKADSAGIYRALNQLEKDADVVSTWNTTGTGPAIRVYSLSAQGRKTLATWHTDIISRIEILQYFLWSYDALPKP